LPQPGKDPKRVKVRIQEPLMITLSAAGSSPAPEGEVQEPAVLAVWLTREEVAALIALCAGSTGPRQVGEEALLAKLGSLYQALNR
jgi:hypothetical protein